MSNSRRKNSKSNEVSFKFEKSENYQKFHASGATGGIQPRGEYKIDFFTEELELPGKRIMNTDTGEWVDYEPKNNTVVRELQTGVLMNRDEAFSLASWIISNIFELPLEKVEKDLLDKYREK